MLFSAPTPAPANAPVTPDPLDTPAAAAPATASAWMFDVDRLVSVTFFAAVMFAL